MPISLKLDTCCIYKSIPHSVQIWWFSIQGHLSHSHYPIRLPLHPSTGCIHLRGTHAATTIQTHPFPAHQAAVWNLFGWSCLRLSAIPLQNVYRLIIKYLCLGNNFLSIYKKIAIPLTIFLSIYKKMLYRHFFLSIYKNFVIYITFFFINL